MKNYLFSIWILLITSCVPQNGKVNSTNSQHYLERMNHQIDQYIVEVFEDSKGNLWFGTLEKGVAKYDGNSLKYFSTFDGLPSSRIPAIIEDKDGNLWFGTGSGISKYDGNSFTNYSVHDGLCSNMISKLFIDSKGILWIGSWEGVCRFDGFEFISITLPYPSINTPINPDTRDWITDINEDEDGNIWFARDGYGICIYNGESFIHLLTYDGLHSNNITEIEFDRKGNAWLGSRVAERDNPDPLKRSGKGGVNMLSDKNVISFPEIEAFNTGEVYEIYKDYSDNIWIGTTENGIFKYNGKEFQNFDLPVSAMSMMEDQKGNIWLGCAGGLYKINVEGKIINVTINGPWN